MFLKSLTLKGFKSFAETTNLELEPGITVVVGPNGSGKSNVVDAIAWVLGAQAPSAVRSQKMDDVIFAGTTKRAALGRAEVSLTINNADGTLPIEFTEVTITRILFRTGESDYAINGVPCRLLDIQELLSDSGVGRQQHVIVSQGQIDAVLNARPEERRFIIEEAAGVLKYRRRKEKAERRLTATEANLLRIQDLLREVRRQLRPLERQADAARRHGDVAAELFGLKLFLAGRELASLQAKLEADARARTELHQAEREHRNELARLDTEVLAAEARLTAVGGADLSDDLVAFESLRERARGLTAVLTERSRGIERERATMVDQTLIANLEAEAEQLSHELESVGEKAAGLRPRLAALEAEERTLGADRDQLDQQTQPSVQPRSDQAGEIRGELAALVGSIHRGTAERDNLDRRLQQLNETVTQLEREAETLSNDLARAEAAEAPLVGALDASRRRLTNTEATLRDAQEAEREAQAEHGRWTARADALALALDQARSRAGAKRLEAIDGVIGTLLDVVEVDPGWEAAFEAAAGEALAALVVKDVATGRRALQALQAGDETGAVLALGAATSRPATSPVAGLGDPVRAHVRSDRADVEALLDQLLNRAVAVEGGWSEALDATLQNPGAVVVTMVGDRFGPQGWRIGSTGAGATRAALEEATTQAQQAHEAHRAARDAVAAAEAEVSVVRSEEAARVRDLDANDAVLKAADEAVQNVERRRSDAATQRNSLAERHRDLNSQLQQEIDRRSDLERLLPDLEAEEAARRDRAKRLATARTQLDQRADALAARRRQLEVEAAEVEQRRVVLAQRRAQIDTRLERHVAEREAARARRTEVEQRAVTTARLAALVAENLEAIEAELRDLRQARQVQTDRARAQAAELEGHRRARTQAERALEEVRERLARIELADAETKVRMETAVETLRRDLEVEPDVATKAEPPLVPEGTTAAARARELERELRLMGPINPLALEEFEALQERHQFLEGQLDDVKVTRRDLAKIIRAIDQEIVEVFASAYADVAANFEQLFETLFPGGKGGLRLTDRDDMLTTGVEIDARPSGKNVRKLSLLSGGERSLTALAFLFAVFRSRPSPFYVMDEVEAALDDVNLHRFLDLIHEFRSEAQLLIVSHQKRTMEAADCLYGVTMQPGGSSRVVSEKVSTSH